MEVEGFKKTIKELVNAKLPIKTGTVITDRHRSIHKVISEQYPEMKHYYDIWHMAKGKV